MGRKIVDEAVRECWTIAQCGQGENKKKGKKREERRKYLCPCLAKNRAINWPKLPKPTMPMVRRCSAGTCWVERAAAIVVDGSGSGNGCGMWNVCGGG